MKWPVYEFDLLNILIEFFGNMWVLCLQKAAAVFDVFKSFCVWFAFIKINKNRLDNKHEQ